MNVHDPGGPLGGSPPPTTDGLTVRAFREADGMAAWPVLGDGAATFVATRDFAESARFVAALGELDGIGGHPPAIDIRADGVTVRIVTYADDWYGMTERDVVLARRVAAAAASLGLAVDGQAVQSVGPIVIGATDIDRIRPFWAALLGYEPRRDSPKEDVVDGRDRGPGVWFEHIDGPTQGRNRMHVAVWVPLAQAEARVAAAIAAGGRVIYDTHAPAWWTLADPEGNEADIATSQNRDEG